MKFKTVHGKKVKRMTGSSRLKLEKRGEQKMLKEYGDLHGMRERYSVENTLHGTAFIIRQAAFDRESPIVLRPWADSELKGKLSNPMLSHMKKSDIIILSRHYSIPLRIIERLQRRQREKIANNYEVKIESPKPCIIVKLPEGVFEVGIEPVLLANKKPKPFELYSKKDLEFIHQQIGIPMWLLKILREREKTKIQRAKSLIRKTKEKK